MHIFKHLLSSQQLRAFVRSPRFGYAISFILVLNFIAVVVETTLDIEESSAQKPWMDICVGDGSEDRFIWIRELLEGWSKAV
ncbi:hypothetical protein Bca52824_038663 [Brassica carinata]|uniref:Uncharacterized protein n=1 Tax=Brassica carinata TaxID=52824 RepID=A0A8X7RMT9_BRACI|nr:hypothetical protein Bca52824_038663 [Brassica carinata]